jgi:hypothetical protein
VLVLLMTSASACSGDAIPNASTPTSSQLAHDLDVAGLCRRVGPLTGRYEAQLTGIGARGAWKCVGPEPTDGGRGGTLIVTWAAPSVASERLALRFVRSGFRAACAGPAGSESTKASDGSTGGHAAPPRVDTQYAEGRGWVAFVQINAPLDRVASVLHGRAVAKHCG